MRVCLLRCLLFPIPLLLALVVAERWASESHNGYQANRLELERKLASVETLVVGSSHEADGVVPADLGAQAANIAYGSQDLYYDAALVHKYVPSLPRLRLVIAGTCYFSFGSRLCETKESWRQGFYRREFGIPDEDAGFAGIPGWVRRSYLCLYGLQEDQVIVTERLRTLLRRRPAGEGPGTDTAALGETTSSLADDATSREAARARAAFHSSMIRSENAAANVSHLGALCADAQHKGARVALITSPVCRAYADALDPEHLRTMQACVRSVSNLYQVPYYDYLRDARFSTADFKDPDHLNASGAHKFSAILRDEVVGR